MLPDRPTPRPDPPSASRPTTTRSGSGYRLERHEPVKRVITILLVASMSLGAFLGSYKFGEYHGMQRGLAVTGVKPLTDRIKALEAENGQLLSQTERLRRTAELDQKSVEEVRHNIGRMEGKLLELNEELSFYKTIVAPSKLQSGLHVQDFRVEPGESSTEYFYTLVLTQARVNNHPASGEAALRVSGIRNGRTETLSFSELASGGDGKILFGFKYFQSITGKFILPAGFVPSSVTLQLSPAGTGLKAVRRTYRWSDIQSGGV